MTGADGLPSWALQRGSQTSNFSFQSQENNSLQMPLCYTKRSLGAYFSFFYIVVRLEIFEFSVTYEFI